MKYRDMVLCGWCNNRVIWESWQVNIAGLALLYSNDGCALIPIFAIFFPQQIPLEIIFDDITWLTGGSWTIEGILEILLSLWLFPSAMSPEIGLKNLGNNTEILLPAFHIQEGETFYLFFFLVGYHFIYLFFILMIFITV